MNTDGYIMLADFGLAKICDDGKVNNTFVGTPEYMRKKYLTILN